MQLFTNAFTRRTKESLLVIQKLSWQMKWKLLIKFRFITTRALRAWLWPKRLTATFLLYIYFILYDYLSKMQPVKRMSRFPVSQQLLEGILFKIRNWWSWILHIPNIFPCHMHSHIYLQYCKMQMRHVMLIVLVIMEQY